MKRVVRRGKKRRTIRRRVTVLEPTGTVRLGRRTQITGQLTNRDGQGVAGAEVQVLASSVGGPEQLVGVLSTDPAGNYAYTATGSTSRTLRFAYSGSSLILPVQSIVKLVVPAVSSLQVSRRRVLNGQTRAVHRTSQEPPDPRRRQAHPTRGAALRALADVPHGPHRSIRPLGAALPVRPDPWRAVVPLPGPTAARSGLPLRRGHIEVPDGAGEGTLMDDHRDAPNRTNGGRVRDTIRKRLTYANVMSTLAVFIALGGSSYAALTISGSSIKNRSIAGKKLRSNTLTGSQIKESRLARVPRAREADRLNGVSAADLKIKCPADTFPIADVCVGTDAAGRPRRTGAL